MYVHETGQKNGQTSGNINTVSFRISDDEHPQPQQ
jgi:hypothetical protein